MKVYLILFLILVPTSLAYTANSTNFKLYKAQEGYALYNTTDEFTVLATNFEQDVTTNINSTNFKTCQGFYCLFRIIPTTPPTGGGGGGIVPTLLPRCVRNETLTMLNGTFVCVDIDEVKRRVTDDDIRLLCILLNLILLIIYLNRRKKRKDLEEKLKELRAWKQHV